MTSKEFTSIVTDSLENVSETGVTDNTELAQSTANQVQHSNQFNITGTVSGGIPLISGSASSGFTSQDSNSQSATDSRKHAVSVTQKASSRTRQEHKVTISTTTVAGTSEMTTRTLKNLTPEPIRIDYFSLMRKWRVRLYRYGLRMTYDLVIPEPAGAMREAYEELATLQKQLGPFTFNVTHADITEDLVDQVDMNGVHHMVPKYRALADTFGASVSEPKKATREMYIDRNVPGPSSDDDTSWHFDEVPFTIDDNDYEIDHVTVMVMLSHVGSHRGFYIMGTAGSQDLNGPEVNKTYSLFDISDGTTPFLQGARGSLKFSYFFEGFSAGEAHFKLFLRRTDEAYAQWVATVWNDLYNAAQTQYYARQQDISSRIAELEQQLDNVDTLTLRREESDEIMKNVLRFLLGPGFDLMPDDVLKAFTDSSTADSLRYGVGFTGDDHGSLGISAQDWSVVEAHEDIVRFVNQAIEWENVVTFLYSYFWDIPAGWKFIRTIRHPDADRQAFLRAGSARVVLTVRKGWEQAWTQFVEYGTTDGSGPDGPYLDIAKEIAAYDDRNYPGIPPANPGRSAARLEDAVYAACSAAVAPAVDPHTPVAIGLDTTKGFTVGSQVVVDVFDDRKIQETATVTKVLPEQIEVTGLVNHHDGTQTPFPVVQSGEKGVMIAEWNEYTPTSGTDIAVTSNLELIV